MLPPSVVVSNSSPVSMQPATREEQNSASIEEAGVGPMAPLVDAARSDAASHRDVKGGAGSDEEREVGQGGRSSNEEGGEETETAPEAEPEEEEEEDDSITRCICDFLHDDGYMICCDKCS